MDSPYATQPPTASVPAPNTSQRVFHHQARARWAAIAKLVGGTLLAFFALAMLALNILIIHPTTISLHATTTLPMIMGVFLFSSAVASLKSPGRIELTDEAIQFLPGPRIEWPAIAFASVDETAGGQQRQLRLLDPNGKRIAQVASSIENFDGLVAQVREKVGQHTAPEITSKVRIKKARRQSLLSAGGTVLLLTAGVFIILDARWNQHAQHQLQNAAIEGAGVVTEKFVAPNGVTTRIRYTITGSGGREAEQNVEISRVLFDTLAVGDSIAVRYVPDEPEISRLLTGEIEDQDIQSSPTMSFLLGGAAIAMSLFLAGATVMFWKGYDFKVDGEGARLVPLGE